MLQTGAIAGYVPQGHLFQGRSWKGLYAFATFRDLEKVRREEKRTLQLQVFAVVLLAHIS